MKYIRFQMICIFCIAALSLFACTRQFKAVNWKQLSNFHGRVWSLTFSPSGKMLAVSSADTTLTLYDKNWNVLWQTNDQIKEVSPIDFSPDEQFLAIPKYQSETDTALIDLNNYQVYHILSGHTDWVTCVDFSPDGEMIASGSDDASVRLWKKIGQSFIFQQSLADHGSSISNLTFSQDSKFISVCGKNIVRLYYKNYDLFIPYQTITIDARFVNGLAFSPDGQFLAVGTYKGKILIFKNNGTQFVLQQTLTGHKKMVHSIVFSKNGHYMASGSWDASIRIWTQINSEFSLLSELHGHKKQVYDLAFHPNGKYLASGSEDQTVLIWKLKRTN
ncbi:MAG: WD40 repeat domain-containing protein [Candidatus Magnetomorum sp.]|nr:WD40 repeat domain-containing protein [Candidatus Magnetomorum sp.]